MVKQSNSRFSAINFVVFKLQWNLAVARKNNWATVKQKTVIKKQKTTYFEVKVKVKIQRK